MSSKTRTSKTRATASTTGTVPTLQSVLEQTVAAKVRTDTEDKLWEASHANPNRRAADLSRTAKIGKSTAQQSASDAPDTDDTTVAEGDLVAPTEAADDGARNLIQPAGADPVESSLPPLR